MRSFLIMSSKRQSAQSEHPAIAPLRSTLTQREHSLVASKSSPTSRKGATKTQSAKTAVKKAVCPRTLIPPRSSTSRPSQPSQTCQTFALRKLHLSPSPAPRPKTPTRAAASVRVLSQPKKTPPVRTATSRVKQTQGEPDHDVGVMLRPFATPRFGGARKPATRMSTKSKPLPSPADEEITAALANSSPSSTHRSSQTTSPTRHTPPPRSSEPSPNGSQTSGAVATPKSLVSKHQTPDKNADLFTLTLSKDLGLRLERSSEVSPPPFFLLDATDHVCLVESTALGRTCAGFSPQTGRRAVETYRSVEERYVHSHAGHP